MHKECPKCSYVRTDADPPPITDCPNCGIVYAKVEALNQRESHDAVKEQQREEYRAAGIQRAAERQRRRNQTHVCTHCGDTNGGTVVTRGNLGIEIILWLTFLVPGIIYSIWRLSSRYIACPTCGASALIPIQSPRGRELMQSYHADD